MESVRKNIGVNNVLGFRPGRGENAKELEINLSSERTTKVVLMCQFVKYIPKQQKIKVLYKKLGGQS